MRRTSPAVTGALVATYVGAFGLSDPLAKKIGVWPFGARGLGRHRRGVLRGSRPLAAGRRELINR